MAHNFFVKKGNLKATIKSEKSLASYGNLAFLDRAMNSTHLPEGTNSQK